MEFTLGLKKVVSFIFLFKIHSKLQYVLNDGKTPVSVYCTQIHNLKYFSREKFLLYHYHLTEIVFYYTNTYWQLCIRWWPLVGPVFLNNNFNFNNINIQKNYPNLFVEKWQKNSLKFLNLKKKKKKQPKGRTKSQVQAMAIIQRTRHLGEILSHR